MESDARIETKREVLAEMNDFEPHQMFKNLLKYDEQASQQTILTLKAVQKFLDVNNIKSASEHLLIQADWHNFFKSQLKTSMPDQMTFQEFVTIVVPQRSQALQNRVMSR